MLFFQENLERRLSTIYLPHQNGHRTSISQNVPNIVISCDGEADNELTYLRQPPSARRRISSAALQDVRNRFSESN